MQAPIEIVSQFLAGWLSFAAGKPSRAAKTDCGRRRPVGRTGHADFLPFTGRLLLSCGRDVTNGVSMPTGQGARRSGRPRAADEELGQHALAIISFVYNRVIAGAAPVLRKRLGLSVTEARIVFFVGASGSMSANKLARYLGLDKAAISRGANRLVELGLIVSERDQQNQARNLLSLTEAGEVACEAIGHFTFAREEHLLSVLGAEEQRRFLESLRKVLTMVEQTNALVEAGKFWPEA